MLETRGLTKEYPGGVGVKDLNLHVEKGEIYGFLGPNGAGKTTTILMLLGLLKPTRGEAVIFGSRLSDDYFDLKRRIGVVSEVQYVYGEMTALEYLTFFGQLYGVSDARVRANHLLGKVDLYDRRNEFLRNYSKGMLQKVNVARALIHDPDLLILDEPVSSLDPYGIKQVRDIIMEEHSRGKTFFISSHLLSEVERTCNRVGILSEGVLVAEDTMQNLRSRLADEVRLVLELDDVKPEIIGALRALPFVTGIDVDGSGIQVRTKPDADYRLEISRCVTGAGGAVLGLRRVEMSLEDAFITITEKHVSQLARKGA